MTPDNLLSFVAGIFAVIVALAVLNPWVCLGYGVGMSGMSLWRMHRGAS